MAHPTTSWSSTRVTGLAVSALLLASCSGSSDETAVAQATRGLGCDCTDNLPCSKGFCSLSAVCTTNDAIECQSDSDCGCKARCIVDGAKKTCQIPCGTTTDCPGTLTCAALTPPWTTTGGETIVSGCVSAGGGVPARVTWVADIQPLVSKACAGCHTGGGVSGGVHFDTYADTQQQVSNCPPAQTRTVAAVMAEKVSPNPPCGGRMPQTGGPLSGAQIQLLADWVAAGAPEQ